MDEILDYLGKEIVIDTKGPFVYIGVLETAGEHTLNLKNADVHDMRSTKTSQELYILETRKHGIRTNRKRVSVMKREISSISLLEDVVEY